MSSSPSLEYLVLKYSVIFWSERARSRPGCRPETCLPFQTFQTLLTPKPWFLKPRLQPLLSPLTSLPSSSANTKIRPQWSYHTASPTVVMDSLSHQSCISVSPWAPCITSSAQIMLFSSLTCLSFDKMPFLITFRELNLHPSPECTATHLHLNLKPKRHLWGIPKIKFCAGGKMVYKHPP